MKNFKNVFLILLFTCCHYFTINAQDEKIEIGHSSEVYNFLFQWWETTSDQQDEYLQLLRGKITSIKRNSGSDFNDGDWNIFIEPDIEFESLLYNSKGDRNKHDNKDEPEKDGKIELEILTPFPLDNFFKVGDNIETFGWWVEDYGHRTNECPFYIPDFVCETMIIDATSGRGKTEIHPFIYLKKTITRGKSIYFSAFDVSGRFDKTHRDDGIVSPTLYDIPIYFRANPNLRVLNASTSPPISTKILKERASFDRMLDPSLDEHTRNQTFLPDDSSIWSDDFLLISPRFKGDLTRNDDESENMVTKTRPMYFAEISDFYDEDIFEEVIESSIIQSGNQEILNYNINLSFRDLQSSSGNTESFSSFSFEHINEFGEVEEIKKETASNHEVSYNIRYSPRKGLNQTEFDLEIFGFDKTLNIFPPFADQSMVRSEDNTYFRAKRTYKIRPSKMSMETRELPHAFSGICPLRGKIACITSYKLTPKVYLANERLTNGRYRWKVRFLNRYDGSVNSNPVYSIIPEPQYSLSPLTTTVTPFIGNYPNLQVRNEGDFLEVEFLNNNGQSFTNADEFNSNFNASKIEVICESITSIGEKISFSQILEIPKCECDWRNDLRVIPEMIPRLIPAILLADYLEIDINSHAKSRKRLPTKFLNKYPKDIQSSLVLADALDKYRFKSKENKAYVDALLTNQNSMSKDNKELFFDLISFYDQIKKIPTKVTLNNAPNLSSDVKKEGNENIPKIIMKFDAEKIKNEDIILIEQYLIENPNNNISIIGEGISKEKTRELKKLIKSIYKKVKIRGFSKNRISCNLRTNKSMDKTKRILIRRN